VTLAPAAPQVAAAPPSRVVESGRNGLPARKSPQEPLTAPPEEKLPSGDPALIRLPPMLPRQASGFLLQAGVFNSTGRAEEIYATLQKHGVPATLEARVQVGPFRNKAEAEQARSKLQALGIDVQVLAPNRGH
jgi:cell division protein FtsN